jgi:hypothetical protein
MTRKCNDGKTAVLTLWKPQGREKKGPGREGNDRQDLDAAQRKDV